MADNDGCQRWLTLMHSPDLRSQNRTERSLAAETTVSPVASIPLSGGHVQLPQDHANSLQLTVQDTAGGYAPCVALQAAY